MGFINETGKKYGFLIVLGPAGKNSSNNIVWKCQCSCGRIEEVTGSTLRAGKKKECTLCRSFERYGINPGDKKGALTLLRPYGYQEVGARRHPTVLVKCDCGNVKEIRMDIFKEGKYKTCGKCNLVFGGEEIIASLLSESNIPFEREKIFFDLKRYDFFVNQKYIIEYDGIQHFKSNEFFGGKEGFNERRKNDLIKNKYCFDNNIPLIRIPYNADYIIDDLKLETTRFLLTPENEEKYYENNS